MKISFSLLVFFLLPISSLTAQEDYEEGTVYLRNGESVPALVKVKSEVPLKLTYKRKDNHEGFKIRKVERIVVDSTKYFYSADLKGEFIIKLIYEGALNIYSNGEKKYYKDGKAYVLMKEKFLNTWYRNNIKDTVFTESLSLDFYLAELERKKKGLILENSLFEKNANKKSRLAGNLSFLKPDAGLELKLSNKLTWYNSAGYGLSQRRIDTTYKLLIPDIQTGVRYFFNQYERPINGKSSENFSGGYIQMGVERHFSSKSDIHDVFMVSYGSQENNPTNISFSRLRAGVGIDQNSRVWIKLQLYIGISGGLIK